ncbi:hypothetical protein [Rhizobium ruizarguesonis]|uniref:hypothetical protein n=1 Tax=Rhizobium ruizarguesonis TaxID=2081791 RepID=UPI00148EEF2E|nr:hypothetical protein [Rhizobium ruizarguesonis]QJS29307.1 hypothetical protein RLTA1_19210 [Rhizobium leguminosarum bv. trifolii TA1]UFW93466.1 hypothetical protein RlegTA1_19170 [Rhizobium ruizarguesonis]
MVAWPRTIKKNPETRSAIYDGPVVKLIATTEKAFEPFQPIIVDKYGDMLVEATDFLRVKRSKSKRNSVESTYQYARVLADLLFVFDSAGGGAGVPYWNIKDDLLLRLRTVFTGPKFFKGKATGNRGITGAVWNAHLSLLLQFLLHCERRGWTKGLIGVRSETQSFQVNLDRADPFPVMQELELAVDEPDEVVIPDDDAVVAAQVAMEEIVVDPLIQRRNRGIVAVMDEGLRRKEAVNLPVSAIPSGEKLKALRAKAQETGRLEAVPIRVHSAKTDQERMVMFPLIKVERLREFIDYDRPKFKPAKGETAVFLSRRNGKRLVPQTITNLYGKARSQALVTAKAEGADELHLDDIRRFHGHVLRHRRVTDGLADRLEGGLDPVDAMTDVMASAGMSFQTMLGYLHPSQQRRKSVLIKRGLINQLREDDVLRSLAIWDKARLDALTGRKPRRGRRRR